MGICWIYDNKSIKGLDEFLCTYANCVISYDIIPFIIILTLCHYLSSSQIKCFVKLMAKIRRRRIKFTHMECSVTLKSHVLTVAVLVFCWVILSVSVEDLSVGLGEELKAQSVAICLSGITHAEQAVDDWLMVPHWVPLPLHQKHLRDGTLYVWYE